jgi:hypothetical protein
VFQLILPFQLELPFDGSEAEARKSAREQNQAERASERAQAQPKTSVEPRGRAPSTTAPTFRRMISQDHAFLRLRGHR